MSKTPTFDKLPLEQKEHIKKAFDVCDSDNSGSIDPVELRQVLKILGEEASEQQVRELLDEIDLDGNGLVSLNEFTEAMAIWMTQKFINTFFNFYHLKNLNKNLNENLKNLNTVDQNEEKENLKNYFIKKFATIILFIAEEVTELSFNTTIDFRSNVITCKFIEFAVNCDQDLLAISYLNNLQNIVDFSLNDFTTFTLQNVYFFKKLPKELFPTILKFITNYKNLLNLRLVNKYFNNFIVKDLDIWKYSIYYFLIENDKFSNCNVLTLPFYKFENYLIKYFNNNIFKFFLLEIKPKLNILDFLQKFNSSFKIYNQLISVGISQSEISNIVNLFNNNDYNKSKTIISTTTPILPIDFPKETEKLNFLAQIDCNDFKHCLQSCILPNFCNDKNTNGIFYLFIHTEYNYNNTDNGIVNLIPEKSKAIVYYYNGNAFQLNFDSNIYKNISTYGIFNNRNKCWKEDLQLFMTFEQKEEENIEPSFNMLTCSSNTLFGSFKNLYNKEDYNDNKKEDNKEDDDYIFLFKGLFYSKEVMEEYVDVVKPIAKIYISRRELFELCEKCDREGNNDFIYRFNNTRLEINKFVHY
ncbi:hypothetical protein ABK040_003965 [Willaertia magna]